MATTPRTFWPPLRRVVGRSMEPALADGDLVLSPPWARRPRRGDVVVLRAPSGSHYVKRVAGVEADVVELEAGRLRVNGLPLDGRPRVPGPVVARWDVPPGHVFVVGDNSRVSDDSRTWDAPFVPTTATRRAWRVPPRLSTGHHSP